MLDTKGPEIRSGFFANGAKKIELVKDETIVLTSDYSFKGDKTKLACSYPTLATSVNAGQQILVADGSLVLTVLSTDPAAGEVTCRIENNAAIGERKNMNLPGVIVDLPTLTEKDIDDITNWGIPNNIDFIAASFVRRLPISTRSVKSWEKREKESRSLPRSRTWKVWRTTTPSWKPPMPLWLPVVTWVWRYVTFDGFVVPL